MKTIKEINKAFDKEFDRKITEREAAMSDEEFTKEGKRLVKDFYTQQILSLIEEARNEGYWNRKADDKMEKEMLKADEAHRTKEGWCCACGYDMAVLEEKTEKAKKEIIEELEGKKKIDYAIQQFTGMNTSQGRDVYAVCLSMGLLPSEWKIIKKECKWLNDYEIRELEDYIKDQLKVLTK